MVMTDGGRDGSSPKTGSQLAGLVGGLLTWHEVCIHQMNRVKSHKGYVQ